MTNKDDKQHTQDHKQQHDRTSERGFASMDPERQREIAAEGGRAAHEKGTAHEFDSKEAREAGSKGGQASHSSQGSNHGRGQGHEFDSEEAREAGSKGGKASHRDHDR
ncbi:MAG TPA: hypothetical protein K8U84_02990 [Paenalcaligenes hominis]|uniref:Stress-induced protein n=1 Tax=Paenalcaligenes hominis TaxID=643674 RepID=A0A9D2VFF7_9BURK|nr:hypothetical protein [Paenalcaligenes hominis]